MTTNLGRRVLADAGVPPTLVIPAQAGIQTFRKHGRPARKEAGRSRSVGREPLGTRASARSGPEAQ